MIYTGTLPNEGVVGVWHNTEGDAFFKDRLLLYSKEEDEIKSLTPRKLSEWYCSRYLLHILSGRHDRGACIKDKYGKPRLQNSDFDISISHSDDYTAIAASPSPTGVDIQKIVPKIERIQYKFASDKELGYIQGDTYLEGLHVIWGAKEAMYKAYGLKELDFRKHIFVEPFRYSDTTFRFDGRVHKGDFIQNFNLFCTTLHKFILVYAYEVCI